jgi:Uma2 family endonuclease
VRAAAAAAEAEAAAALAATDVGRVTFAHNALVGRVVAMFATGLPNLLVVPHQHLKLSNGLRLPDICVVDRVPDDGHIIGHPPIVVAEVLSPHSRTSDLLFTAGECAQAGVGQFWVIDPELGTVEIVENCGSGWVPVASLDSATPPRSIEVGEYGSVLIDPRKLFA